MLLTLLHPHAQGERWRRRASAFFSGCAQQEIISHGIIPFGITQFAEHLPNRHDVSPRVAHYVRDSAPVAVHQRTSADVPHVEGQYRVGHGGSLHLHADDKQFNSYNGKQATENDGTSRHQPHPTPERKHRSFYIGKPFHGSITSLAPFQWPLRTE